MDRRGRKRRGKVIPYVNCLCTSHPHPGRCRPWSFLSGIYSLVVMMTLMSLIYLMLEYHCSMCGSKCDINNLSKNIDDIANNLSIIKQNYQDLELKMSKFSLELPKIEGQIDILESLANTLEKKNLEWNPRSHLTLPNVDVYLNKPLNGKNVSSKCTKCNLYKSLRQLNEF